MRRYVTKLAVPFFRENEFTAHKKKKKNSGQSV